MESRLLRLSIIIFLQDYYYIPRSQPALRQDPQKDFLFFIFFLFHTRSEWESVISWRL